jgi:Tol biopolymer transport system component/tRNA A-37 threonylcarbamoyl transferase component Bud32
VTGWAELKAAFRAIVEGAPGERERRTAQLRVIDPALPEMLDALLEADARGDPLMSLVDPPPAAAARPDRIGNYDVIDVLGAGAMGEVYRARDPRLGRDVAIKVLRDAAMDEADRLARFEREARVLAAVNHPRVAHVYGLEAVGESPALVMELVEGPTLAEVSRGDRSGRLPVSEALRIAAQVADGLSAAHDCGIVHRDLKPGNIALTADGNVKVLDFGIAKRLAEPERAGTPGQTIAGTMLGTPAYMSPEQARGEPCDQRADIWAFGCVLVELLTGRSPFARPTASESLAAVLEHTPDLTTLPARTPEPVRTLIRHCLDKDPQRRLRDIADARLILEDAVGGHASAPAHGRRSPFVWIALAAGIVVSFAAIGWLGRDTPVEPVRVVSTILLPQGLRLGGTDLVGRFAESHFAVAPDGRRLVIVASEGSGPGRLWIRELSTDAYQPLAGTDGASAPFWSPDGTMIGFIADGRLRTISASGGTPLTVASTAFMQGSWSREGQILFAPAGRSPLHVVAAIGGAPRPVTQLDMASGEVQHSEPAFLPDGRRFLYFSHGSVTGGTLDPRGVFIGSLDPAEAPRLLVADARQARYAAGHLLFVRGGTLMAQPFDADRLVLSGTAAPIIEDVRTASSGVTGPTAAYSVSDAGLLAHQAALRTQSQAVLVDRGGREVASLGTAGDISDIAVSPDGHAIAVSLFDTARSTRDLWVYSTTGGPSRRVTFDAADDFAPVWSPDGARLLFSSSRQGLVELAVVEVNGTASPQPFETDREGVGRFAADWSRDNRAVLYIGGGRAIARSDLFVAPLPEQRQARALLDSPFVETHGRIAPTGDWMAYTSNETGRLEVYADRFPALGDKRIVSADGAGWPRWSHDGRELFYVSAAGDLLAATVRTTNARLQIAPPGLLFPLRARAPVRLDAYAYDVLPDGRFVVNRLLADPGTSAITVVLNWTTALERQP